ncbi:MAG: Rieske 2Fe-2S domain-containing protein [Arenicella sp.]|nr:Rieske 2Fe-2S domain-containing protein [Arenicella sp.]
MPDTNLIAETDSLEEGGKGHRFNVRNQDGEVMPAFVIRFDYQFFAYLNKCGHIAVELDYMPGEFFTDDGRTLICSTHGAEYAPDTGACLGGPCYGVGLESLGIAEREGRLYLDHENYEVVSKDV